VQDAKLNESNVGDAVKELRKLFDKALKDDADKFASGLIQRAKDFFGHRHSIDNSESEFQREFKSADQGRFKVCIKSSPCQTDLRLCSRACKE
jgi:hypothetical protein